MSAQQQYLTLPTENDEFVQNQAIDGKEKIIIKNYSIKELKGLM
jgi:hypothetical protein